MAASKSITVFLLDDHDMVRRSVAGLLDAEPDIEVVSESANAAGALPAVASSHPRVALLDVRLKDGNGIEVCREIRSAHPEVRCLMLTSFSDDRTIVDAALAGADGVIVKQIRDNDIVRSVRDVASGMTLLDEATVSASMERLRAAEQRSSAAGTADSETNRTSVGDLRR
jgi:DNA-binding NarL/FixJ family response regulator